ncbi:flagellar basal body rod protein FlgC [Defluviitalea saccharophila]|uniref:Flagellar basal-body rod protein FlgC n=1 Tax=Defluviitalea saccharophila TaxID=879970 RepID=A0ABZ2Y4E2_9FIRM|nr:flagellar basal body rod protein FlgC [Candidatus Epulonipiscium sp.]
MSFFNSMNINASGLTAQRLRMDIISQNIANINTTRTENGQPYRRKTVLFEERNTSPSFGSILKNSMEQLNGSGVRVSRIAEDNSDFKLVYEPEHPDADENGYVRMPNVNIIEEMVNMISANRSYEANVTAMNTNKNMALKALEIGR